MKYLMIVMLFITSYGFGQDWNTSFEAAKHQAKAKDQKIVLVFSGSDWCAPCMKLEKEIWKTETFKNYAKDHFTLLKADFPRRKKNALSQVQQEQNKVLAERYNKNGYFPLVVVLDQDGKMLGQTGYKKMSPQDYIKLLNTF